MKINLDRFDYLVIAGGIVNMVVIVVFVTFWLLH